LLLPCWQLALPLAFPNGAAGRGGLIGAGIAAGSVVLLFLLPFLFDLFSKKENHKKEDTGNDDDSSKD